MSRKLRVEEEKARALRATEEEEVEDKLTVWSNRAKSPLVWKTTGSGFRIEDCKEKHFQEVLQIFKEHYMLNEVLCKNTELMDDEESVECYLERVLFNLKDKTSLIAVDENYVEPEPEDEGEKKKKKKKKNEEPKVKIAGVLILRVVHKLDYLRVFSRVQLVRGEALKTCVRFRSHISRKGDIYGKYDCEVFLRYYDLCILPEYRHKRLGYSMMLCGLDVARTMDIPVVMGLFTNYSLQKLAKKIGMETVFDMRYTDWRDKEGELIFDDPGAGNYSCDIMAGLVPPPPPRAPPKPTEEEEEAKNYKLTRAEKRMLASKGKLFRN